MSRYLALPRLWHSSLAGERLAPLAGVRPLALRCEYNEAYDTKRRATLTGIDPDALPRDSYVLAELDLVTPRGDVTTIGLGHYVIAGPDLEMRNTGRRGTVQLRDISWWLHTQGFSVPVTIPAGMDTGAAARLVLTAQGVPPARLNIPDSGVLTTEAWEPLEGDTVLSFVTDLLAGGAMYQPWVAADDRLTSIPARDIRTATPDASYRTVDGAKIVPPVKEPLSDLTSLYNSVTVRRIVPGQDAIEATATVTDPSSPVHPDRIAEARGWGVPVVLPKRYDEPMLAGVAEAQQLAQARLSEGASRRQELTVRTYPDHTLDGHQILELALVNPVDGVTHYTGSWWQQAWTLDVGTDGVAIVERTLFRTERW